jgi:hypothetical protein
LSGSSSLAYDREARDCASAATLDVGVLVVQVEFSYGMRTLTGSQLMRCALYLFQPTCILETGSLSYPCLTPRKDRLFSHTLSADKTDFSAPRLNSLLLNPISTHSKPEFRILYPHIYRKAFPKYVFHKHKLPNPAAGAGTNDGRRWRTKEPISSGTGTN